MEIAITLVFIALSLILLNKRNKLIGFIVIVYVLAIIYLVFISREPTPMFRYSIKPFVAVRRGLEFSDGLIESIISGTVKISNWGELKNIILNIMLFIPFGYLLPCLFPRLCWWQVIPLGFGFSLCIELLKLLTRLGFADVDDLINNTLGATLGWIAYRMFLNEKV